jgi:hypothetical protein
MSTIASPIDRTLAGFGRATVTTLTVASLLLLFLVSSFVLNHWGLEYDSPGGSPFEKIHPATYAAILALIALTVVRFDPIAVLDDIVQHHKGLIVLGLMLAVLIAHAAFVQRTPLTMVFDTFFLPMLLLVLMTRVSEVAAHRIALMLHALMALNAIIGLGEFALQERITPYIIQGVPMASDWRSTALLGHPLSNAGATGVYILALIIGGGRDLPGPVRAMAFALQIPAMAVFGGRAAMMLLILFGGLLALRNLVRVVAGRRISLPAAATLSAVLPTATLAITILVTAGFFDRFIERFVEDQGSAETRINMFILLRDIPLHELFFGPDQELVATLQRLEGLEWGIESFWVAFIAFYGIMVSVPFFIAFGLYLRDVWLVTQAQSGWIILYFLAVCSTSASLSGKTTALAIVIALILGLFRLRPGEAALRR